VVGNRRNAVLVSVAEERKLRGWTQTQLGLEACARRAVRAPTCDRSLS
jgi:hypothetical protein